MPDLHQSARKYYRRDRLDDATVLYAAAHVVQSRPLDDEDDPRRWLMIGTDPAGRLLELVALIFDALLIADASTTQGEPQSPASTTSKAWAARSSLARRILLFDS